MLQKRLTSYRAPITAALNEKAFLRVMSSMTNKSTFNEHIQDKSKPAPASKAAALVDQPAKATKESTSVKSRSTETPAEAFEKLQAGTADECSKKEGSVRLAPTPEFAFPPSVTKSGGKHVQGSSVSVHIDGVETAATFNSAGFATQPLEQTQSGLDPNHGTSPADTNSSKEKLTAKEEGQSAPNRPGNHVVPPADYAPAEHKDDLITLDQGDEEPRTGEKAPGVSVSAITNANGLRSPDIPDIMDEELNDDVPQTSLTPNSLIAPRTIEYRGLRYIRANQIIGQKLKEVCKMLVQMHRLCRRKLTYRGQVQLRR